MSDFTLVITNIEKLEELHPELKNDDSWFLNRIDYFMQIADGILNILKREHVRDDPNFKDYIACQGAQTILLRLRNLFHYATMSHRPSARPRFDLKYCGL